LSWGIHCRKCSEASAPRAYGLLPLINEQRGHRVTDQIKALRRQLASDMGFVMPAVRILDNMQLGPNEYVIRVKEVDSGRGEIFPGKLLLMDPKGQPIELPGTHTNEPAFGLPATWVDSGLQEEASFRGYTVVDPGTVLTTHLTEVLKNHMAELLSYAETKKLLDDLPAEQKKLVEELIPSQIPVGVNIGHGNLSLLSGWMVGGQCVPAARSDCARTCRSRSRNSGVSSAPKSSASKT
jgi:flagellar biosynthesis protein FlhA